MSGTKKFKLYLILLLVLLFGCTCTEEQPFIPEDIPGSIVGIIKPAGIEAQISLIQGTVLQTITADSATGYFEIQNIDAGVYNLEFFAPNYGRYILNEVVVYANKVTATPDIFLKPLPEQILLINPADGATNIPLTSPFEIEFSVQMNQPSVQNNFFINPAVNGYFIWENTVEKSKMSFYPDDQYETNKNYTATLTRNATTIYGDTLSFDVESHFTTEGVKVLSTIPEDQATFISPQAAIYIYFNSKMNRESVENNLLLSSLIDSVISGDFKWLDSKRICFEPGDMLASNTEYTVTVKNGAMDIFYSYLENEKTFSFRTEPLMIKSSYPANGATFVSRSTPIVISFNTYVNQAAVENSFSISPAAEGWYFQWSDLTRFQFMGTSKLQANTQYTVTIDVTCIDFWQNHLPVAYSFAFTTGS